MLFSPFLRPSVFAGHAPTVALRAAPAPAPPVARMTAPAPAPPAAPTTVPAPAPGAPPAATAAPAAQCAATAGGPSRGHAAPPRRPPPAPPTTDSLAAKEQPALRDGTSPHDDVNSSKLPACHRHSCCYQPIPCMHPTLPAFVLCLMCSIPRQRAAWSQGAPRACCCAWLLVLDTNPPPPPSLHFSTLAVCTPHMDWLTRGHHHACGGGPSHLVVTSCGSHPVDHNWTGRGWRVLGKEWSGGARSWMLGP
jgi:hypothetical protein